MPLVDPNPLLAPQDDADMDHLVSLQGRDKCQEVIRSSSIWGSPLINGHYPHELRPTPHRTVEIPFRPFWRGHTRRGGETTYGHMRLGVHFGLLRMRIKILAYIGHIIKVGTVPYS
jgi:hypothetical protein